MKRCPNCGKGLLKIVYGMPSPELFEASERGEIILGGCCVFGDDPAYYCKQCKTSFSADLKHAKKDEEESDE